MQATLEWSYELLDGQGQRDLAGLSVFSGGFTLDAAEAVCDTTVDRLASLVDHNLIQRTTDGNGSRYTMLETIREYAALQLEAAPDAERLRRRHAEYLLALGDAADTTSGLEREVLMQRLAPELDNLRAAIRWGLLADAEIAFGLIWVAGVCRQAPASELRRWVDDALANTGEVAPARRVKVIRAAGNLANANQEPERARDLYEQARGLYREIGDQHGVAWTLAALALVASRQGDDDGARHTYAKSLALYTSLGNTAGQWLVINHLGKIETSARNFDRARQLLEQAVELATADSDSENLATSIHGLGDLALETGDAAAAGALYRQAMSLSAGLTAGWPNIRICLAGLAAVAGARGDAEAAGVLWGAAESLEKHLAMPLWPDERRRYRRTLEPLPQDPLEAAIAIGRALTLDEAVARALQSS